MAGETLSYVKIAHEEAQNGYPKAGGEAMSVYDKAIQGAKTVGEGAVLASPLLLTACTEQEIANSILLGVTELAIISLIGMASKR